MSTNSGTRGQTGRSLLFPAGKQRRSFSDGLGRLIEVDEPGWGDGLPGKGSVTIGGAEQSTLNCGDLQPPHCPTVYDQGWVSITVNGVTDTADYQQGSTATSVASALAGAINGDPNSPVNAGVSGTTINLTAKLANASTNYSLSTNADSTDPNGLFGASFGGSPSGSTLTGARDPIIQADPSLITPMMTTYTYDVLDDLTAVSQAGLAQVGQQQVPGQPRSYAYDSLGRLTSSTTPESGTVQFFYTTAGGASCAADASAVCRKTDARSITSTYTYDGLNRVTGVTYSDGTPSVAYGYDAGGAGAFALGRLTSVTVGSGSPAESYTYDQLGRILTATESVDGTPYAVGYSYNPDNSLATITYPSGRTVTQSYDAIGRMLSIADATTTYLSGLAYNGAGQATAFQYGNGVQAAFTYNDHLQLATLEYSKANAPDLLSLKYDYNQVVGGATVNNGQIQAIHFCTTEPVACSSEDATRTENFTYDPWSRLSTAQTTDTSSPGTFGVTEHYDRFGNRLNQTVTAGTAPPLSVVVDASTNRITGSTYAYDAAGNMTNDTLHSYTYDAANWLTKVDGGSTATYTYLGALRVKKVTATATTVYVYSGTKPIAEYVGGTLSNEYIYAGSAMLATVAAGGAVTYEHPDQLSIRAESDASGNLIRSTGHFPFGEQWYDTSPGSKWQFTTYERDGESQLDYATFRSYSSRLGRFMQQDPLPGHLASPESLSRYTYVLNDPVDLVDPSGLDCVWVEVMFVLAPETRVPGFIEMCIWDLGTLGRGMHAPVVGTPDTDRGGGAAGKDAPPPSGKAGPGKKSDAEKEVQCEEEARAAAGPMVTDEAIFTTLLGAEAGLFLGKSPGSVLLGAGVAQLIRFDVKGIKYTATLNACRQREGIGGLPGAFWTP